MWVTSSLLSFSACIQTTSRLFRWHRGTQTIKLNGRVLCCIFLYTCKQSLSYLDGTTPLKQLNGPAQWNHWWFTELSPAAPHARDAAGPALLMEWVIWPVPKAGKSLVTSNPGPWTRHRMPWQSHDTIIEPTHIYACNNYSAGLSASRTFF